MSRARPPPTPLWVFPHLPGVAAGDGGRTRWVDWAVEYEQGVSVGLGFGRGLGKASPLARDGVGMRIERTEVKLGWGREQAFQGFWGRRGGDLVTG